MKVEIKRRIQKERGRVKRERKRKFRYLKNTNQFDNYLKQKSGEKPKENKKLEVEAKKEEVLVLPDKEIIKLKWYKRLWNLVKVVYQQLNKNYHAI